MAKQIVTASRRGVAILPDEFSVENTLLTPTLKVRRRVVEERYAALLATLYTP